MSANFPTRNLPGWTRKPALAAILLIVSVALVSAQTSPPPAMSKAYQVYSEMRNFLESQGAVSFRMRMTPIDTLTGRAMTVMEANVLRSYPYFSTTVRVVSNPIPEMPTQMLTLFDGRYMYSHASGKFEATRMDFSALSSAAREQLLRAQIPPIFPDLPRDAGNLREEIRDRRVYQVVSADRLENECHGFKRFALWIDAQTKLPYRMEAEFQTDNYGRMQTASGAQVANRPLNGTIEYSDWQLNVPAPPSRFGFIVPEGVRLVDKEPPKSDPDCPDCPMDELKEVQKQMTTTIRNQGPPQAPSKPWE